MSSFKDSVDYWWHVQMLEGGPTHCSAAVRTQFRNARLRYKLQLRLLRREIHSNIAEHTTTMNCHKVLFQKQKPMIPAIINNCDQDEQPDMWRNYYKTVFSASETACKQDDIFKPIDDKLVLDDKSLCNIFSLQEVYDAISLIDTDKSYKRHYHWKSLFSLNPNHCAFTCLLEIFNCWSQHSLLNYSDVWDLFDTSLSPIPKNGKTDLSTPKAWRPISIGTSENWVLEKIFQQRLLPFSETDDCQFGYKSGHSASHAIELVRILERSPDCHVCMLDASSAFDKLSWCRIRDQLISRNVPLLLVKLLMKQLVSNRISVCGTAFIYPTAGIKQGGVLSGGFFAMCMDELVKDLRGTGAGVILRNLLRMCVLLFAIIYADDIILVARSPYGLKNLITVTFSFAKKYNDLSFNTAKSWILRLGRNNFSPVSVCNISTSECQMYLGVPIGKQSNAQRAAASRLYSKTHILLQQNRDLHRCRYSIKNLCINSYGTVFALETFLTVDSYLRQAHRNLTRSVHTDWRNFSDLPGPNIRSRTLYTTYELDSLEVQHRRRRNNFLIAAEQSNNSIVRTLIGFLPRITA